MSFLDNMIIRIQLMEGARQEKVEKCVARGSICAYPKFTSIPFGEVDLWNSYDIQN